MGLPGAFQQRQEEKPGTARSARKEASEAARAEKRRSQGTAGEDPISRGSIQVRTPLKMTFGGIRESGANRSATGAVVRCYCEFWLACVRGSPCRPLAAPQKGVRRVAIRWGAADVVGPALVNPWHSPRIAGHDSEVVHPGSHTGLGRRQNS